MRLHPWYNQILQQRYIKGKRFKRSKVFILLSSFFLNALLTIHKAYRVGGFLLTQYSQIFELIEQTAWLLCQKQAALSITHVLQVTKYHNGFFLTTIVSIYLPIKHHYRVINISLCSVQSYIVMSNVLFVALSRVEQANQARPYSNSVGRASIQGHSMTCQYSLLLYWPIFDGLFS